MDQQTSASEIQFCAMKRRSHHSQIVNWSGVGSNRKRSGLAGFVSMTDHDTVSAAKETDYEDFRRQADIQGRVLAMELQAQLKDQRYQMHGPLLSEQRVGEIAASWTEAWNARDLDALMFHYADDVVFLSPTVILRDGEPSGTIRGKTALTKHFSEALESFGPSIKFTLLDACVGVGGYALYYARETGAKVIVVKRLNAEEKIVEARVHYHSAS